MFEFDIVALVAMVKDGIDMLADSSAGAAINIIIGVSAAIIALMTLYNLSSKSKESD